MFNKKLQDQVDDMDRIMSRNIILLKQDYDILFANLVNLIKKHDSLQKQMDLLLDHLGVRIENTPAKIEIVRNV